jgi:O-antigen ligase
MSQTGTDSVQGNTIVGDMKTVAGEPVLWPLAFLVFISAFVSFISLRALGSMVPACFLIALGLFVVQGRRFPRPSMVWGAVWLVFVALVGIAALRSLDVDYATGRLSKLALMSGIAILFWSLAREIKSLGALQPLLVLAFFIGLGICLFEGLSSGLIYWLTHDVSLAEAAHTANRPVVLVLLFAWPVALVLARKVGMAGSLVLVFVALIAGFTTESQSAQLAGFVAMLVLLLSWAWPKGALWMVGVGGVVSILGLPIALTLFDWTIVEGASRAFTQTILPRLELWAFVVEKISERPLLGFGLEAGRFLPLDGMAHKFFGGEFMHHPHNGILQVWFEMGLVGAGLFAMGWGLLITQIGKQNALTQRYALAAVVCVLVISTVSHGLWQTWWISALVMLPFFFVIAMSTSTTHSVD